MQTPEAPVVRSRFLRWLDRYIYVDRLKIGPIVILPGMTGWQRVWYVAVVMTLGAVGWVLFRWLDRLLESIEVPGVFALLIYVLISGLILALLDHYVLPARAEAVHEGWLNWILLVAGAFAANLAFPGLLPS